MFRASLCRWLPIGLLLLVSELTLPASAAEPIRVYAAASAAGAVQELAARYGKERGVEVTTAFAASSALARQIEQGAPADVFLCADSRWMDDLDGKGKIVRDSRRDLLGNRLVLVAPKGEAFPAKLEKGFDLPGAFQGRWCSCDASVPVGRYARQALTALGWWGALEPRLAAASDARAALAFVERGECAAGIVYETDAKRSDQVEVLGVFPADTHAPVRYPVARVRGGQPAAQGFLDFLRAPAAAEVFRRHGFAAPD